MKMGNKSIACYAGCILAVFLFCCFVNFLGTQNRLDALQRIGVVEKKIADAEPYLTNPEQLILLKNDTAALRVIFEPESSYWLNGTEKVVVIEKRCEKLIRDYIPNSY